MLTVLQLTETPTTLAFLNALVSDFEALVSPI